MVRILLSNLFHTKVPFPHMSSEFHSAIDKSPAGLKTFIANQLTLTFARDTTTATARDWWLASSKTALSVVIERMIATMSRYHETNAKRVYYLSLEFLMGRLFSNTLHSAGIFDEMEQAIRDLGLDPDTLRDEEYDMGLGNGGLGRLAACFLDSLATLDLPAIGYGIHYQYGLFKQEFRNGYQIELPDAWMTYGTPWEIVRPEHTMEVEIFGHVENVFDDRGSYVPRWTGTKKLLGVLLRYSGSRIRHRHRVNYLRLLGIPCLGRLRFCRFQSRWLRRSRRGKKSKRNGLEGSVPERLHAPSAASEFCASSSSIFSCPARSRDIIRRFLQQNTDWHTFPDKCAIQLNDTHPAIKAVTEFGAATAARRL